MLSISQNVFPRPRTEFQQKRGSKKTLDSRKLYKVKTPCREYSKRALKNMVHRPGTCNPSTLRGWGGKIKRSRDQDHPGQHGKTPFLLKIQKLAGCGGPCLWSQLLGRLRQENRLNLGGGGLREPRSRHCTPSSLAMGVRIKKRKMMQTMHLAKFNTLFW